MLSFSITMQSADCVMFCVIDQSHAFFGKRNIKIFLSSHYGSGTTDEGDLKTQSIHFMVLLEEKIYSSQLSSKMRLLSQISCIKM